MDVVTHAAPTGIQPWPKDLEILQRTVENNAAVKGNCIVVACSTCGGDHPRHRGGQLNCKLPASAGARARDTIRGQANKRWQDMDDRAETLSQPQQSERGKRRDQFVNELAAISSDRSVEDSDWVRPDQGMANTLQSYMSQKPKAGGKGPGGGRTAKRKTQLLQITALFRPRWSIRLRRTSMPRRSLRPCCSKHGKVNPPPSFIVAE